MQQLMPASTSNVSSPNRKWIIIAAAIYLALPIDIVPVLGFVGDLTAFFVALNAMRANRAPQGGANHGA